MGGHNLRHAAESTPRSYMERGSVCNKQCMTPKVKFALAEGIQAAKIQSPEDRGYRGRGRAEQRH